MRNPACTVCPAVMDPVAGAFQNYGDEGLYRDQWGGKDSLPELFKDPEDGTVSPYKDGDPWFRDMRQPGFDGIVAPNTENRLQWLAQRIVADERFAEATVKFWWSPVMGVDVAEPPEYTLDVDYQGRLLASSAQAAEVRRLAAAFRGGIASGRPYNLRDLLTELVLSPWFRADPLAGLDPMGEAALPDAGIERPLTPEELVRKTEAIAGYSWGRRMNGHRVVNRFTDSWVNYRLLYGGIDSDGITERSRDLNPLMAAVAQSHAAEISCPIVYRELYLTPDSERLLFDGIDPVVNPSWESGGAFGITEHSARGRQTPSASVTLSPGRKTLRFGFQNGWDFPSYDRNLRVDKLAVRDSDGEVVDSVELETLPEIDCGTGTDREFALWWGCPLSAPVSVPKAGTYRIEVVARQEAAGGEAAKLRVGAELFDVVAEEWDERQTFSVDATLAAGRPSLLLQFDNDWSSFATILLDGLIIWRENCETVKELAFGSLSESCGHRRESEVELQPWHDEGCRVKFSVTEQGNYRIEVTARRANAEAVPDPGEGMPSLLSWLLEAEGGGARGETLIRTKIAGLAREAFRDRRKG